MKKRAFAIFLAAALVAAMPLSALAAGSIRTGTSGGGGGRATTVASTGNDATTADGQSLVTNGAGSQVSDVEATFAVGDAETAGLAETVVSAITRINSGASLDSAVNNAALEGYTALTKTSAIVLKDKNTNSVANREVNVTLYVPNLISGLENVKILCYENATGQWKVIEPLVNYEKKTVTFIMYGSGTVSVIYK